MAVTKVRDGLVYKGTPRELINTISREIVDALNKANMGASPIHVLAMLHIAASRIREMSTSTNQGKPPSLKSVLSVVMRGISGDKWTDEEARAFDEDFCKIVESLGGERLDKKKGDNVFIGPSLGVH